MFASEGFLKALKTRTEVAAPSELIVSRPAGELRLSVSAEAGVGGMVWEAAAALADWLGPRCVGKRVVELGSGTGVLGLCLAQQGAARVVLTDRFDVLHLLRASAEANRSLEGVSVRELAWGVPEWSMDDEERFDWIVASEVIYNGNLYDKLLATICELFERAGHRETVMIMSFERRSSEDRWMEMVREKFERVETHTVVLDEKKKTIVMMEFSQPKKTSH